MNTPLEHGSRDASLRPPEAGATPLTFPSRPRNGGNLLTAPPKFGQWLYEPKYCSDWRALVHVPTGRMWNRRGERISIEVDFQEARTELLHRCPLEWLDCLAMGRRLNTLGRGCLSVLDAPQDGRIFADRKHTLLGLFDTLPLTPPARDFPRLSVPPLVAGSPAVWAELQAVNQALGFPFYEGLVAKRADSLYPLQLDNPEKEFAGWMKHRFG